MNVLVTSDTFILQYLNCLFFLKITTISLKIDFAMHLAGGTNETGLNEYRHGERASDSHLNDRRNLGNQPRFRRRKSLTYEKIPGQRDGQTRLMFK